MMHCTIEDLLALRANEGSVWARRHIETCDVCRGELDALYQRVAQLKALPALRPARDRWPVVREALRAGRAARRQAVARWGSLAAAATLATLLLANPFGSTQTAQADLIDFKERSATLESQLASGELENRVMRGWEAALAAELEDRIAVIDGQLVDGGAPAPAPAAEVVNLWRQRVDLMERLYTVRRAAYQGM
jgi:hypothetical protein